MIAFRGASGKTLDQLLQVPNSERVKQRKDWYDT